MKIDEKGNGESIDGKQAHRWKDRDKKDGN